MSVRLSELDTIIFDLGRVIVDLNPELVIKQFESLMNSNHKNIPDLIDDTDLLIKYETNQLNKSEFIAACNEYLQSEISEEDFTYAWNLMIGDIPIKRLEFINSLRKTHQVLILSNTSRMHEICFDEKIEQLYGAPNMAHFVDTAIYSHDIELRKPDNKIYQYVIEKHLDDPSKALFLDDRIENVEAAIENGIKSIQVAYPDQIFEIFSNE